MCLSKQRQLINSPHSADFPDRTAEEAGLFNSFHCSYSPSCIRLVSAKLHFAIGVQLRSRLRSLVGHDVLLSSAMQYQPNSWPDSTPEHRSAFNRAEPVALGLWNIVFKCNYALSVTA